MIGEAQFLFLKTLIKDIREIYNLVEKEKAMTTQVPNTSFFVWNGNYPIPSKKNNYVDDTHIVEQAYNLRNVNKLPEDSYSKIFEEIKDCERMLKILKNDQKNGTLQGLDFVGIKGLDKVFNIPIYQNELPKLIEGYECKLQALAEKMHNHIKSGG